MSRYDVNFILHETPVVVQYVCMYVYQLIVIQPFFILYCLCTLVAANYSNIMSVLHVGDIRESYGY